MKNLYFTNPLIGAGLPVLTKHGAMAKQRLIDYVSRLLLARNYTPLASPAIGNAALFEKSGHYPYYKESMFPLIQRLKNDGSLAQVAEEFVLKPMNCPFHIMAYDDLGIVSYKELPVKFYEFGQVYRYEDSGALNGLYRVRSFTQDDGHLFCMESQIEEVVMECVNLISSICADFKLKLSVKLSIRDLEGKQEKYIGQAESWSVSEKALLDICKAAFGLDYMVDKGGAAFYGPKIDFVAKDSSGREWQLGTVQLDFNLPERFELRYINDKGENVRPVLVHRALLGSLERFLGVLAENNLVPLHLQPFNMGVVWIGNDESYLHRVVDGLKELQIYPSVVKKPKHLNEGMAQLYNKDISNIVVIGKREEEDDMVSYNKAPYSFDAFLRYVSLEFS